MMWWLLWYLFVRVLSSFLMSRGLMVDSWLSMVNFLSVVGRSITVMYQCFLVNRCLFMDGSNMVYWSFMRNRSRWMLHCWSS